MNDERNFAGLADAVRSEQMIEEIESEIRRSISAYALPGAPASRASLTFGIREVVGRILDALRQGRGLSDDDRDHIIEVAAERAARGGSLTSAVDALHVAVGVTRRHLLASDAPRAEVTAALDLVADLQLDLIRGLEAGWRDVEDGAGAVRGSIVRQLLEGRYGVHVAARARRSLQVDLAPPFWVIQLVDGLDDASDPGTSLAERVHGCARSLPGPAPLTTAGFEGAPPPEHGAIVVPSWREDSMRNEWGGALADAVKRHELVAFHAVAPATEALPPTWQRLCAVAGIAQRCADRLGPSFDAEEARLYYFGARLAEADQRHLLRTRLGPLMLQRGGSGALAQIETLEALYALGESTAAAETLGVDAQTIRARVRRIQELTGRDVQLDRTNFDVAMALYRLYQAEWAPPGDPWWEQHGSA